MIGAAEAGKFNIRMPNDIILRYIGKPEAKRNRVQTANGETELWYFHPEIDEEEKAILDKDGEPTFKVILKMENGKVAEIRMP